MHTTEWDRDLLRQTLTEIMNRANLNQAAVGRLAGRDRTMANRWLKGQHQPNYEAALNFARAIALKYPHLAPLSEEFLRAAGYLATSDVDGETSPPPAGDPADAVHALALLRKIAEQQEKTIGDILVERGLATPEELTLSEQKRGDRLIKDILESDLPDETKNILIMDYIATRRHHFREQGLIADAEEPEKK
ncbi:hypothetical protein [Nonomuraea sp. NPDC049400]|uniref:hypothetical protein n=1 Tax=Nonomuraea sp. NPDC049400 TaxID=3364352 RepID=UPI0037B94AD5